MGRGFSGDETGFLGEIQISQYEDDLSIDHQIYGHIWERAFGLEKYTHIIYNEHIWQLC